MKLPLSRKKSRGSILVMSVFFLIILYITASAFITLLPVESREAQRTEKLTQSSLAAEAGITEALNFIRYQLQQNKEPMASNVYSSNPANRTKVLGNGWKYRWELQADSLTYPTTTTSSPIRGYTIISTAYYNDESVRQARAETLQRSLTQYTQLYNDWPSNLVYPVEKDTPEIGGKVHVNDVLNLWIPEGLSFWNSTGAPPFSHGLTASAEKAGSSDGFGYYQGNYSGSDANKVPYNSGGAIAARYARLVNGGKNKMDPKAPSVTLPTNTFDLQNVSWGYNPTTPLPANAGVYVNVEDGKSQGVYIKGNVKEMQLGYGGSQPAGPGTISYGDNSWVKIELPYANQRRIDYNENVTVVTVKETPLTIPAGAVVNNSATTSATTVSSGTTLIRRANGKFETYPGDLNGVVYVDGNIDDLWGVNKGRRTIATADNRTVKIGGREVDSNTESGQATAASRLSTLEGEKGLIQYGLNKINGILEPPKSANNTLGLISKDIKVSGRLRDSSGNWDTTNPKTNPLYIYAAVLGGINGSGGYDVENYNTGNTNGGWVYTYGAQIVTEAGPWAVTDGRGLSNGSQFPDGPSATYPPPYFPGSQSFDIKSYQEYTFEGQTI